MAKEKKYQTCEHGRKTKNGIWYCFLGLACDTPYCKLAQLKGGKATQ